MNNIVYHGLFSYHHSPSKEALKASGAGGVDGWCVFTCANLWKDEQQKRGVAGRKASNRFRDICCPNHTCELVRDPSSGVLGKHWIFSDLNTWPKQRARHAKLPKPQQTVYHQMEILSFIFTGNDTHVEQVCWRLILILLINQSSYLYINKLYTVR